MVIMQSIFIVINSYVKKRLHTQQSCKDRIVTLPEDYYYSSAGNYASLDNDLKVILLDSFLNHTFVCQFCGHRWIPALTIVVLKKCAIG
jgi:hypothetical protein